MDQIGLDDEKIDDMTESVLLPPPIGKPRNRNL